MATTAHPIPPTIVVNAPGAMSNIIDRPYAIPQPDPARANGDGPSAKPASAAPSISTNVTSAANNNLFSTDRTNLDSAGRPTSCYLCDEQNPGDFSPTTKYLDTCLLCARHFCPIHKDAEWDSGVCNINHAHHYRERLEAVKAGLSGIGSSRTSNDALDLEAEETLIGEGVYPSLGEREKAIFKTSPVSDAKMRQLEMYRSLDAQIEGTVGAPPAKLIEEKDWVGADIAV